MRTKVSNVPVLAMKMLACLNTHCKTVTNGKVHCPWPTGSLYQTVLTKQVMAQWAWHGVEQRSTTSRTVKGQILLQPVLSWPGLSPLRWHQRWQGLLSVCAHVVFMWACVLCENVCMVWYVCVCVMCCVWGYVTLRFLRVCMRVWVSDGMLGGRTFVLHNPRCNLDSLLMLFARDATALSCWCVRASGLVNPVRKARAHKSSEERTVAGRVNANTMRKWELTRPLHIGQPSTCWTHANMISKQ